MTWPSLKPFIIGTDADPYLKRWFVLPRNRWCNVYVHKFCRSDDDRATHCHPWMNASFLLRGEYIEVTREGRTLRKPWRPWAPWRATFRSAETAHRVELIDGNPVWTLFITGPKVREWYFHCPKGLVHWRDFVAERPGGNSVGKGCGE